MWKSVSGNKKIKKEEIKESLGFINIYYTSLIGNVKVFLIRYIFPINKMKTIIIYPGTQEKILVEYLK